MDVHWMWWLAALVVIAAELATGTIYLLMLALGLAAAGLAALLGQGSSVQLLVAALVTGAGCWAVQRRRARQPAPPEAQRNADVHIDLGNTVQVDAWALDRTASVNYRGARWQVRLDGAPSAEPLAGKYSIAAMDGSVLVLASLES
jgi:membrane protein implicated in regulation of membrane protease activity